MPFPKSSLWELGRSAPQRGLMASRRTVCFIPRYTIAIALIFSSLVFFFAGDDDALLSRTLGTLEQPPSAVVDEVSGYLIKLWASRGAHHPTDCRAP